MLHFESTQGGSVFILETGLTLPLPHLGRRVPYRPSAESLWQLLVSSHEITFIFIPAPFLYALTRIIHDRWLHDQIAAC